MVAAFPIAKLGVLFLKQLSKPIANYAKERAKTHPFFRKYICMPPAQCKYKPFCFAEQSLLPLGFLLTVKKDFLASSLYDAGHKACNQYF